MNLDLFETIEKFAQLTKNLDKPDLEKPWAWRSYDGEGIHFAFFRTYEELQELAVKLELERMELGVPITSAQRILGQYHLAYRDLEAVLLNVAKEIEGTPPFEGEWSIRETLAHMLAADLGFYVAIRFAMESHHSGVEQPEKFPEEAWEKFLGLDEEGYDSLMKGSYQSLREHQAAHHLRVLGDLAYITERELELGSRYWENEEMDLMFRLHRFDSHLRQHTVQMEKTMLTLGITPSESKRLLRHIYRALGECENRRIGMPEIAEALCEEVSRIITERTDEIATIF